MFWRGCCSSPELLSAPAAGFSVGFRWLGVELVGSLVLVVVLVLRGFVWVVVGDGRAAAGCLGVVLEELWWCCCFGCGLVGPGRRRCGRVG
jgi:hypothetical protein